MDFATKLCARCWDWHPVALPQGAALRLTSFSALAPRAAISEG